MRSATDSSAVPPAHWLRTPAVSVWIPGAPELGGGREERRDYRRLVRAWCAEEAFPSGVAVELAVHTNGGEPPALERLRRTIEAAAAVEVVKTAVVCDGRQGVRLTVCGPGTRAVQLTLGLSLDGGHGEEGE